MGLRDRIAGEAGLGRSNGDGDGDGVSYYRRRLLEEVNLSEIAELSSAAAPRRGSSASSGAWSRARAPCSRPPSARG